MELLDLFVSVSLAFFGLYVFLKNRRRPPCKPPFDFV